MDLSTKINTSRRAKYCLQCFFPKVFLVNVKDRTKHHETECYVSSTNKHKFSCLNKPCLQHSWTCQNHVDENRPLLDAHYMEFRTRDQQMSIPPQHPTHSTGITQSTHLRSAWTPHNQQEPHRHFLWALRPRQPRPPQSKN